MVEYFPLFSVFHSICQRENATVSIVHSYTKNPEEITSQADIVISAAGVANLVRGSWIKPGAIVIDVGINPVDVSNDMAVIYSFIFYFPFCNFSLFY